MKPNVIIMGKLPPPYMGPAVATKLILDSELNKFFNLIHVNTTMNSDLSDIGKWKPEKAGKNLQVWINLVKAILKHKPVLVLIPISQSTTGFLKDSIYIILAKLSGTKVLLQLRGSDFRRWLDHSSIINQWYVKSVLKLTSGMIVLGEKLKHIFKDLYPEDKIFVIPNGADYTIPVRNSNNNNIKLIYLGNLQSSKGIEDVIRAVAIVKNSGKTHFTLDIIGAWRNDQVKSVCLELIKSGELPVTVHGQEASSEKLQYLANSDIFIFPPREPEGHPWVVIEAMAAGLPIISTDQGAITESVLEGRNGFIISPSNPEQLAEKISFLIDNPAIRQRMGEESRKLYLTKFTGKNLVENMTRTFNSIAGN